MLRQKRALYARKIVENAVEINMEARNNYLFRKKKAGMRGRPSTTDSPTKE